VVIPLICITTIIIKIPSNTINSKKYIGICPMVKYFVEISELIFSIFYASL
jgi:hypothetical protein